MAVDVHELGRADRRIYNAGLAMPHERQVVMSITDLDHNRIATLDNRVLDGQVTVRKVGLQSAAKQSTRVLTTSFLDPKASINFDPESPADEALWVNRMLEVVDRRYIDGLGWVTARPFIGPLVGYERTGQTVAVTAFGKERLAQRELGEVRKWAHGTKVVKVLRDLAALAGETRLDFPSSDRVLPHDLSLSAKDIIWVEMQKLARSIDMHLYYPGSGRLRLRRLPQDPVFRFSTGEGGHVIGDVTTSYSLEDFSNVVIVTGKKPRGAKQRVTSGPIRPSPGHPLSPESMARVNGTVPLEFKIRKENPKLTTNKACKRTARRILVDQLTKATTAKFDSVPVSHRDEGDLCVVEIDDVGNVPFRLAEFAIPVVLTSTATMPVGYRKRTSRW